MWDDASVIYNGFGLGIQVDKQDILISNECDRWIQHVMFLCREVTFLACQGRSMRLAS